MATATEETSLTDDTMSSAPECPEALTILYQDDHFVAVKKPSGIMVHRSRLDPAHRTPVLQRLRDQLGRRVNPIHRLDRPTSGVLLFGFDTESTRQLSEAFAERRVQKTYWAVVRGHPKESGRVDCPVKDDGGVPRMAVTAWRRLETVELPIPIGRYSTARYALLELQPETGRKHQLRRHCEHLRHPIIGDTTYGEGRHNRLFREHFDAHRLLLFAQRVCVPHPAGGHMISVVAPVDGVLQRIATAFGWRIREHQEALNPL